MSVVGGSRYPEPRMKGKPSPLRGDSSTFTTYKPIVPTGDEALDKLGSEAEKLVALLKEPESGNADWHMFLHERIKNMHELTGRLLKK